MSKERSYSKASDSGKPSPKVVSNGLSSLQKYDFCAFVSV